MGLSRRAYAAHRKERGLSGGVESAVRKAIAAGRITLLPDGTIDPARADAEWERSTNSALQRSPESLAAGVEKARDTIEAGEVRPVPPAAAEAVQSGAAEAAAEFGGGQTVTYAKARAAKEAIGAQLASLRLKRMRGELVDRKAATQHVFDLARKERDHWLQLPARAAANLAAEFDVDAHAMEIALDRLIRGHLALLSEIKIELAASEV